MNVSIHSLYWDNSKDLFIQNKRVCDHFELPVNYYNLNGVRHGTWMDEVLKLSDSDIIGFFDIDCVPTNKEIIKQAINYCVKNNSFIGIAQASNHIPPSSHIFAAPAFFFITKSCYLSLDCPSFCETNRSDVAQEVSYRAEELSKPYKAIYPKYFEKPSTEGVWKLGNYGKFGVGTYFNGGIYHLYQGRFSNNIELFTKRCDQIITKGTLDFSSMVPCVEE